jgi:hypothetical protein
LHIDFLKQQVHLVFLYVEMEIVTVEGIFIFLDSILEREQFVPGLVLENDPLATL